MGWMLHKIMVRQLIILSFTYITGQEEIHLFLHCANQRLQLSLNHEIALS